MKDPYDCMLTKEEVILDLISKRVWGKIIENVHETVREVPIEISAEEAKK